MFWREPTAPERAASPAPCSLLKGTEYFNPDEVAARIRRAKPPSPKPKQSAELGIRLTTSPTRNRRTTEFCIRDHAGRQHYPGASEFGVVGGTGGSCLVRRAEERRASYRASAGESRERRAPDPRAEDSRTVRSEAPEPGPPLAASARTACVKLIQTRASVRNRYSCCKWLPARLSLRVNSNQSRNGPSQFSSRLLGSLGHAGRRSRTLGRSERRPVPRSTSRRINTVRMGQFSGQP